MRGLIGSFLPPHLNFLMRYHTEPTFGLIKSVKFIRIKKKPARRFPPPWSAEVTPNCFIVRDANGQALSYIYYESEPGRRSAAKLLSKDEARRIAANIAKLLSLLRRGE
jgi:hypothetical protein